jgi:uncharacterized protein YrzB (UPF0473 family)
MENKNYFINVTDEYGIKSKVEILDMFTLDEYKHDYIMYSKGETNEDGLEQTYVSILAENEDGSYTLKHIDDDKEWEQVEEAIKSELPKEE